MENEVASLKKHHVTPPQHVTTVQRLILPTPPSKSSPRKIIHDSNNNQMETKILRKASILNEGQETNQIKNVLEFIQKTMETFSAYEKQFQGQLNIKMIQTEM